MDHVGRAVPQQQRSREKYERILDAADASFAAVGVTNTQMAALAQSADVSIGTLYRLFTDRNEIALALAGRYSGLFMVELQSVDDADLTMLEAAVNDLVDRWVAFQKRHPGYRALLQESPGGEVMERVRTAFNPLIPALADRLEPMLPDMERGTLERIVGNAVELIRHFLVHMPDAHKAEAIEEVKQMIALYVCGRLRPDSPVRWPPT